MSTKTDFSKMKGLLKLLPALLFSFLFSPTSSIAQDDPGYRLEFKIEDFPGDTVFLGFRRGEKFYSKDTVGINADGKFVFEGEKELQPGSYLILMPPENNFIDFVLNRGDQRFSLTTKGPDYLKNHQFKGSKENPLLLEYQVFMAEALALVKQLNDEIEKEENEKKKQKLEKKKTDVTEGVVAYKKDFMQKHPGTYVAKLIAAFLEPEIPEAPLKADGTKDERFGFNYYKAHYWDGWDWSDDVFLNSPYLKQKVDRYIGELTLQTADSVVASVDYVLTQAEQNDKYFKFLLPELTNRYHKPELMGLDKAFVHIANKYYASGKVDWMSEETIKKITDDAYMNNLVLLGRTAQDIKVQLYDHEKEEFTTELISPHDIKAEFTVVFLWKPGCGFCKQMTEQLIPVYEEWKDKGLEVFSITSANHMDLEKAIKDIKAKKMPWIITADPYSRARAMVNYYGTSLPRLYVLDKDKKIIANRIGAEQVPGVIEKYRKQQEEEKKEAIGGDK